MVDFSLLQQPNFAQAALSGYQAGATQAKQNQIDTALQGIDLNRPETLLPVLRADPSTGAALIGASTKLAAEQREQASQAHIAAYVKQVAGALPGAAPVPAAAPSAAPVSASPAGGASAALPPNPSGADSADIVVTAQQPAANPNAVRDAAIDADPTGFLDIQSKIASMTKAQRDTMDDATSAFASVGQAALNMPLAQRRGFLQAQAGYLTQHGVSPQQIASFDPTDDNLHTEVGKALGVKGILDQHNKELEMQQTAHHQGVEESQGAQRIGLEAQNVGIAGGHLALARNADARAAAAAKVKTSGTSGGGIATPTNASEYNALPAGAHYYKNGAIRIKQ